MKFKITLCLLFLGFIANAKFQKGTVYYNDGRTETGLINSFMEHKMITMALLPSIEKELNLTDKSIKFKLTEDAEVKTIGIDDIKSVTLYYENNTSIDFKVLYLKTLNNKGEFKESKVKVFLPLVREGKVNLYGYIYGINNSREIMFYFQNEKEDYAFNYYDFQLSDMFTIMSRLGNPLKELFKDCPEMVDYVQKVFLDSKRLTKEEKKKLKEENRSMDKVMDKEYKGIPDSVKEGDLDLYHQYNFHLFDEMLLKYEECK